VEKGCDLLIRKRLMALKQDENREFHAQLLRATPAE
jgi:hypothetical protein